jgi:hypothetical protein
VSTADGVVAVWFGHETQRAGWERRDLANSIHEEVEQEPI